MDVAVVLLTRGSAVQQAIATGTGYLIGSGPLA